MLYIFSFIYINNYEGFGSYNTDVTRLSDYSDNSLRVRVNANIFYYEGLLTDKTVLLNGLGGQFIEAYFRINNIVSPHNSALQLGYFYGIPFLTVYLLIISYCLRNTYTKENIPYYISFITYLLSGQTGLWGPSFIFTVVVLLINVQEGECES
jgi:hypothetical protein